MPYLLSLISLSLSLSLSRQSPGCGNDDCFHFGLIFTAYGFLSGPLGPWLSGYILDLTQGNYTLVFSYLGIMCLVSDGPILLVQPWRECRL
jgi:hypothetical protein